MRVGERFKWWVSLRLVLFDISSCMCTYASLKLFSVTEWDGSIYATLIVIVCIRVYYIYLRNLPPLQQRKEPGMSKTRQKHPNLVICNVLVVIESSTTFHMELIIVPAPCFSLVVNRIHFPLPSPTPRLQYVSCSELSSQISSVAPTVHKVQWVNTQYHFRWFATFAS